MQKLVLLHPTYAFRAVRPTSQPSMVTGFACYHFIILHSSHEMMKLLQEQFSSFRKYSSIREELKFNL